LLHERLVKGLGAHTAVGYLIDGVPIAVRKLARAACKAKVVILELDSTRALELSQVSL
jgi:hypothetical protein